MLRRPTLKCNASTRQTSPRSISASVRAAFTLLELLIVLAILAALAAMVVPNLLGSQRKANIKTTEASIAGFEQALKLYAADHAGEYPAGSDEVVELLMAVENEEGEAINPTLEAIPKDAWERPLHYEYPNKKATSTKPAIWSDGPNMTNEQGEGDDVSNWKESV